MKAPDKIWVTPSEMTILLAERRNDYDVEYLRKDTIDKALTPEAIQHIAEEVYPRKVICGMDYSYAQRKAFVRGMKEAIKILTNK